MANKDGVLSIGIEYKAELNKMIADLEGGLDTISKNNQLSKGMKQQFDNVIAEVRNFKATMEKELATLGSGKVDKTAFKSFKQTVANNFKSVREDIDRLDLAVSTLNSQMEIISKGVDLSKITKEFAGFEDYVNRTNEAVSQLIDTLGQQGIDLFSFDNRNISDTKNKIKEIDNIINQLDTDKGAKFELFDEKEAQSELDRLSVQLRSTLELMEHTEKQMSNMDNSTVGFKKMQGDFALLQLKAASLNDTIEMLYEVTEGKGIFIKMDDKSIELYDKYTEDLSDNLESIVASAKNAKKELSTLLESQKQPTVKVSSEMNPNSSELATTVTIETTSSELWKKLSPILTDLQGILNSNPVVAPVKLVVAPNAVSSTENGDVGKLSSAYSKKYAKVLAETGKDAVIDLEGVYKKTFTSIMDAGVSYAKEAIGKIQDIFDKSPINIKYDISQEEIDKIQNFVLSNKDGKKIDISGQITKAKQEVEDLNSNIEKTSTLLQETKSKGNVKFDGFDKFTQDISKSIGKLEELQNILKALQNIEITLAKASGLSSITEIENQWESLEKRIINATKLDGSFRKNASINKIASEYQKYIDMGGTNALSDISKIQENKDTIDAIISKAKQFQKQDFTNDSVEKLSVDLDGVIAKFDELISTVKTATNALYKIIRDGNVSDLDKQWSSISNKFKSIADESGKINLSKQKKDVQELMEMYQKYLNAGGMKSPFDLTDNIETLAKLNKVFSQINSNKLDISSISKEKGEFGTVKESVDSLTESINTKTDAIKTEANTMELAARAEVKSIGKIIESVNQLIERIKNISDIKVPKINISDTIQSDKSNISSENPVVESQSRIQEELKETQENSIVVNNSLQNDAKETAKNIHYVTNALGEVTVAYRGLRDSMAAGLISDRYHGGTFWTDNLELAKEYSEYTKVESANLEMMNPLEIEGNGANWNAIENYGNGVDEASKKILECKKNLEDLIKKFGSWNQTYKIGETGADFNLSEFEKLIHEQFEDDGLPKDMLGEAKELLRIAQESYDTFHKISNDMGNVYGKHDTNTFVEMAKANGYDGVIFKNIIDSYSGSVKDLSNVMVTFDKEQIHFLETISTDPLERESYELRQTYGNISEYVGASVDEVKNKLTEVKPYIHEYVEFLSELDKYDREYYTKGKLSEESETEVKAIQDKMKNIGLRDKLKEIPEIDAFTKKSPNMRWWDNQDLDDLAQQIVQRANEGQEAWNKLQIEIQETKQASDINLGIVNNTAQNSKLLNSDGIREYVNAVRDLTRLSYNGDGEDPVIVGKIENCKKLVSTYESSFPILQEYKDKLLMEIPGTDSYKKLYNEILHKNEVVQNSLKATQEQTEQTEKAVQNVSKTQIKDVFQDDEASKINEVAEAINNLAQAEEHLNIVEDKKSAQKYWQGRFKDSVANITKTNDELLAMREYYSELEKMSEKVVSAQNKVNKANIDIIKLDGRETKTSEYSNAIEKYRNAITELQNCITNLNNNGIQSQDDINELNRLQNAVDEISKSIKNMSASEKGTSIAKSSTIFLKIEELRNKYKGMSKDMQIELDRLERKFAGLGNSIDTGKAIGELKQFETQLIKTGTATNTLWDAMKNKAFYNFANQLGTMFSFYDLINVGREGFQTIRELDTALTEMRKVSDESVESLKRYQAATFDVGDAVGATAKTIQNSTADFLRLGESMDEAAESANTANILLNVSEFDSIDEATKSLVSMSQAYQELEKIDIVDKLNNIGEFIA